MLAETPMEWLQGLGRPSDETASAQAELARSRLRSRAEALAAGRGGPAPPADPAVPSKNALAQESDVHEDAPPPPRRSTSTHRKRSSRGAASARSRYMDSTSTRGKASSRLAAMTARDEAAELAARKAFITARISARRSARSASEQFRASPLPTTSRPSPEWRKYPDARPGVGDTNQLWAAAGSPGSPPQAQHQDEKPVYGSQRPLSAQEQRFQMEKSMERKARKRIAELKAQERERLAVEELESKRRRHDLLRAKEQRQRSARGMPKSERKAAQARLYASPRKQAVGTVYQ